ncbi:MAG: nucleotidyltransferase family protein [bacterium]
MNTINIKTIKKSFTPILLKAGVKKSSIFGSFARGEDNALSDIDLLVDFPRGKGLFEFAGLKIELEKVINRKVDLLTYSSISPLIREQILADQIVIYEER